MIHPQNSAPANAFAVSVVVPVRDEQDSIRALLEGLLTQTVPPDEIVIADGGSNDRTPAIINEFIDRGAPVKLVLDKNSLPGRSRNLAVANARYDWIAFIDAGIKPVSGWLEALVEKVKTEDTVDVVYGTYEPAVDSFFKECAAISYVSPSTITDEGPVRPYSIASALMRRDVWKAVDGFPEDLRSAEDLLFMRKVTAAGFQIARAPRAIVYWNIKPGFVGTFRRFVTYSRNNIRAGLFGDWQGRILIYYAVIASSFVSCFFFGLKGLTFPLALWLALLTARGVVSLRRNRTAFPANLARNFARLLVIIPIIAVLDAASFTGTISWLVRDKLGMGAA